MVGTSFDALDTEDISRAEISDHDWKELTWLLRHHHPDLYIIVAVLLKTKIQDRLKAEAEAEESEDDEDVVKANKIEVDSKDDDEDSAI